MEKLKLHTPDITAENIEKLAALFPNCVTETNDEKTGKIKRAIDFDQLRQELSDHIVEGPRERYHLDWPGKREALLAANAPIAKTLRPCREESVDFDTTKNLFIEGDNLDALKLLQETYLGKVKLIYIDPPYNTGNDFIYEDDFSEDAESYMTRSNQVDNEGNRMIANTSANGRFHSDWLSMLYPRLKIAWNLLASDGILMVSIDENEFSNLRRICDELFGVGSFLITCVWRRRQVADSRNDDKASTDHEYVVCYKKVEATFKGMPIDQEKYSNPDNDPRGPWFSDNLTGIANERERPNLHYDVVNPKTGRRYPPSPTRGWMCAPETMDRLIAEDRILWPNKVDGRPRHKKFLREARTLDTGLSSWFDDVGFTTEGTRVIQDLFGEKIFPFSKPLTLLTKLVVQATSNGQGIVLDFFAGSGTCGHAVLAANAADQGSRRYVMVQIADESEAGHRDFKTIADIGKERLRRAGRKIKAESAVGASDLDIGFRVLKIDTSNMNDVYYAPDAVQQDQLAFHTDNIKPDRTPEDLLFQVLLDWGVDLALPIEQQQIAGKTVFFVDGNALAACFDTHITEDLVKELAQRKPLRAVFRDSSYDSDSTKINVAQIFKLLSPETEVKSL
ncbi:site-specific DNA-methyltransferase [Betaproteobacteria bacterium SCN1]|jgi:adenine-specific DNA-methyltransferase|nr:site-specific DNA-methyltransferase [Betaproteobacteria bacterium SCN1]